jgi:YD repeat-containing protein
VNVNGQTLSATTYDAIGQVLTSMDARGNVTHYAYDDAGRRTQVTEEIGDRNV